MTNIGILDLHVNYKPHLSRFNILAQHYGSYFAGFEWQAYGTFTYRSRKSRASAAKTFAHFFKRLSHALGKAAVAYVAVPEYRWSGCGLPAIRLHWHCLMAVAPQHQAALPSAAQRLWEQLHERAKVEKFDHNRPAAYYIAKLAAHVDFD